MAPQIQQCLEGVLVFIFFSIFLFACSSSDSPNGVNGVVLSGRQSKFLSADVNIGTGNFSMEDAATPDNQHEAQREIEEADIVEIDGTNLYILNAYRGFNICDVSLPNHPSVTGRCPINGEPVEMYIRDNKAYVIVSVPQALLFGEQGVTTEPDPYSFDTLSRIEVIDFTDSSNPRIMETMDLEGLITDSRIVGDILYTVSSETTLFYDYSVLSDEGISTATVGDTEEIISEVANVYVAAINLSDPGNVVEVDRVDFGGSARHIHVTEKAIFIASDPLDSYRIL